MSTGSIKSLHFQGFNELETDRPQPRRRTRQTASPRPGPPEPDEDQDPAHVLNPLLAMGNLIRDHQLIGQKLKALHLDESAYHGTLQVVLTALYRMQTLVANMIQQCERQ
jgi:hypothetical protein